MNFTSPAFVLLFPLVLILHRLLPPGARQWLLLSASLLFYAMGDLHAFPLLLILILITWYGALRISAAASQKVKTCLAVVSICTVTGTLIYFKLPSAVFLPAGISFYTFQALSYVAGVYGGTVPAERDPFSYALYISFFPQLVAGPIEPPDVLLPQLKACRKITSEDMAAGVALLLRGYTKKICAADFLAPYVDNIFSMPSPEGPAVAAGALLFGLQIYADFSGYSDIACGCARMLGIRLSRNFDRPYLACGFRDFWRRWHITLNRWFTQMIYIPLGGSRKGLIRRCLLTLLVFLLSGLWHGAAWHYIAWGLVHGLLLIGQILMERIRFHQAAQSGHAGRKKSRLLWLITFAATTWAWLFFRAPTLSQAFRMTGALGSGWSRLIPALKEFAIYDIHGFFRICMLPALIWLLDSFFPGGASQDRLPDRDRSILICCLLALMIMCAWPFMSGDTNAFIYFRF